MKKNIGKTFDIGDDTVARVLKILKEENFTNIKMAHDKEEALLQMQTFLPHIIIMDININGEHSGIDLVKMKNENEG